MGLAYEKKKLVNYCVIDDCVLIDRLVAGYLVHHGYIASAKAFSRWSHLAGDNSTSAARNKSITTPSTTSNIADSVSLSSRNPSSDLISEDCELPPGLSSMLHRRRLRALCLRCQYGRAASTLRRLYPDIVERHPDLLIQLRCRQLIEMVRIVSCPAMQNLINMVLIHW